MGSEKIKEIPQVEGLEFEEETHTYRLDGILIPSVSATVIGKTQVLLFRRSRTN